MAKLNPNKSEVFVKWFNDHVKLNEAVLDDHQKNLCKTLGRDYIFYEPKYGRKAEHVLDDMLNGIISAYLNLFPSANDTKILRRVLVDRIITYRYHEWQDYVDNFISMKASRETGYLEEAEMLEIFEANTEIFADEIYTLREYREKFNK